MNKPILFQGNEEQCYLREIFTTLTGSPEIAPDHYILTKDLLAAFQCYSQNSTVLYNVFSNIAKYHQTLTFEQLVEEMEEEVNRCWGDNEKPLKKDKQKKKTVLPEEMKNFHWQYLWQVIEFQGNRQRSLDKGCLKHLLKELKLEISPAEQNEIFLRVSNDGKTITKEDFLEFLSGGNFKIFNTEDIDEARAEYNALAVCQLKKQLQENMVEGA